MTITPERLADDDNLVETTRPIPDWASPAILIGSVVLSGVVVGATGFNWYRFALLALVVYAAVIYGFSRTMENSRQATDRLVTTLVYSAFLIALFPLISVIWTVVSNGLTRFDVDFFTSSMRGVVGEGGGAMHAIQGTLIITAIAALMSIPIGMMAAVYLVEYGKGRLARALTFFVDVMTGIPSIVAGLFAYALFELIFGPGVRMGFGGAVALSLLMIPVVVRSSEEMLKLVPNELREASYALGVPKWKTIVKIVIPTSIAGLATGVTLAIARVIGETAPLLIIVGTTTSVNLNPFDGRMATLPVFSFYSYTQPGVPPEFGIERAWTAALTLIIIVMVLNGIARLISRIFAPSTGR